MTRRRIWRSIAALLSLIAIIALLGGVLQASDVPEATLKFASILIGIALGAALVDWVLEEEK